MDPHDKPLEARHPRGDPLAQGGLLMLPLAVWDLRCPGMKEGCSGENVLERER